MDKVTIKDLYWELSSDELYRDFIWDGCKDIEVVPRKIVEMIIEKCEEDSAQPFYHDCIIEEARDIKRYAESLLRQFEGDTE